MYLLLTLEPYTTTRLHMNFVLLRYLEVSRPSVVKVLTLYHKASVMNYLAYLVQCSALPQSGWTESFEAPWSLFHSAINRVQRKFQSRPNPADI